MIAPSGLGIPFHFAIVYSILWHDKVLARRLPTEYKKRFSTASQEEVLVPPKVAPITINGTDLSKKHTIFEEPCRDLRRDCFKWAAAQGCIEDPVYMHAHCPVSCQTCEERWSFHPLSDKEAIQNKQIYGAIGRWLGTPQLLATDSKLAKAIQLRVQQADEYIEHTVNKEDRFLPVRQRCRNYDENCAYWAVEGACIDDAEFMNQTCGPVCFACEYLHVESQCPIDPTEKNAFYAGDLNRMFQNIVSDPFYGTKYDIKVLSRPASLQPDQECIGGFEDSVDGPWVVMLDNFLNATEAETLIKLGADIGYERSTDVGDVEENGSFETVVSYSRTSTNAWCNTEECLTNNVTLTVRKRMENLTGIPTANSEALQLLRYEPGQHYDLHHDFIKYEVSRRQGVRILTIFLYLNEVDEGGQTDFPQLRLSVKPKLGRALVWPSVLDEYPNKVDQRTEHRANRVISGIKYGANAWLHQRAIIDKC